MKHASSQLPQYRPGILAAMAATLLLTLLGSLGCGRPAKPVARIGSAWIGQPQWKVYLREHPAQSSAAALDQLVRREVGWREAEKRGLTQGEAWEAFLKQSRQAILVKAYLATQPGPPPFTEEQAKAHYLSREEERHVLHLVCKEKSTAETALRRISKGEPFEKVATALSIDPSKSKNHGDLGWIKRERVVQAFGEAVFTAKVGDLTGPFKTDYGWHVALVRERRAPSAEDFAKNKVRIMHEMEGLNEQMKRPAVLKALRSEFPVKAEEAVLGRDRTTLATPGDEKLVAGTVGNQSISLKELKQFLETYLKVSGQSHGLGPETKRSFLEIMADELRLSGAAEKAGMAKLPEVQAELWESQREAALTSLSKVFLDGYKVSDADVKAHYEGHPDRFLGVGSVKLNLLVADEAGTIDKAAHETMAGAPWQRIYEKYANKASTGNWAAGWVELASLQRMLPKEAIQAMVGKPVGVLIGPISGPEGFMLFKVLDRRPGAVLPLDTCREGVRQDFLKQHALELVDKYLDSEARQGLRVKQYPENAVISKGL